MFAAYTAHGVFARATVVGALAVIASLSADMLCRAGTLDNARQEAKKGAEETANTHENRCADHEDDDDGFGSFLWDLTVGSLFEYIFGNSEWRAESDSCGRTRYSRWYILPEQKDEFAPFPYAKHAPGIIVPLEYWSSETFPFSGRVTFDYGNNFDALERYGVGALAEWRNGFGFDASAHFYVEDLPAGGNDHLSTGDFNLLWRIVETERTIWRFGFGWNWLDAGHDEHFGGNLTGRVDIFPCEPLILGAEIDYGGVGAAMLHYRAMAGVNFHQAEFFVGYDYRSIGNADLEGPMLGMQFWY